MSIRSYKNIYQMFESLFPELAKSTKEWKGVWFKDRHICIRMNDDSIIDFFYHAANEWSLVRTPNRHNLITEVVRARNKITAA